MNLDLKNGDCLELLKSIPSNSIDLVVTDPPYAIETKGAGIYKQADKQYIRELDTMKDGFSEIVLDEICRVLKKINVYFFCSQKQIMPLLDYKDKKKYGHPTVKPLELVKNFIMNSSNEHDTVFDPFMGSGTTGVACVNTNRNFIGMELERKYFDIAVQRIAEAQKKVGESL